MLTRILILSALLLAVPSIGAAKAEGASKTVVIESMKFLPAEITVKVGDSIEWVNKDLVPHTVTATDNSFDSKTIAPGAKWVFKAKTKGRFAYKCTFHPMMLATLIVK